MSSDPDQTEALPASQINSSGAQGQHPEMRLKGRYLIERELGRGGIGVVYLARDERLHSMLVVIKFLLDASGQNAWLTKKFLQEAEALTRINHPGVVRVIDRDTAEDGRPFFVMEYIKGRPLRDVVSVEGIDFEYGAYLLRQIGHALRAAHEQGVVHRDLKPENILLQSLSIGEEQIKLIDFGIAKVRESQAAATTDIKIIAGSQQYIAPEQLTGDAVTAATDIYSLGIIAYELVTGRRPFNPDVPNPIAAMQQLLLMQQSEKIVPPKQLRPSLPEAAQMLILNALAFDPKRRPQDARIFSDDLARALTGEITAPAGLKTNQQGIRTTVENPAQATVPQAEQRTQTRSAPDVQEEPGVPPKKSNPRIALGAAALVALVVLGIFAFFFFVPSPPPAGSPSAATSGSERVLTYSITLQKDPQRYPGSKPFQLPGEVIFSPGDRVRFSLSSPQTGHLYLFNESPQLQDQAVSLNVLFPSPTSNNGSAALVAGQTINIPESGDGFIFDEEEGTEKLWLVWSNKPIPELEAVKRWANPVDKGEIKDATQINAVRDFLAKRSTPAPDSLKDDAAKRTTLTARSEILVKAINLEHH